MKPQQPKALKPTLTPLRTALADKNLLGTALQGDSWAGWRALLLAAMGERLEPAELDHFKRLTHRSASPDSRVEEAWIVAGRRAGKSRAIATLITYLACLCDHTAKLVAGEKGVVVCLAPSQLQASIVLSYISGILEASPILKSAAQRGARDRSRLRTRRPCRLRARLQPHWAVP